MILTKLSKFFADQNFEKNKILLQPARMSRGSRTMSATQKGVLKMNASFKTPNGDILNPQII
jgi:hypothetical protein